MEPFKFRSFNELDVCAPPIPTPATKVHITTFRADSHANSSLEHFFFIVVAFECFSVPFSIVEFTDASGAEHESSFAKVAYNFVIAFSFNHQRRVSSSVNVIQFI